MVAVSPIQRSQPQTVAAATTGEVFASGGMESSLADTPLTDDPSAFIPLRIFRWGFRTGLECHGVRFVILPGR